MHLRVKNSRRQFIFKTLENTPLQLGYFKPLHLEISESFLTIEPEQIDFGTVDAGPRTTKRELTLINSGFKPARYAVDLGTNEFGISVTPMRGIVMEGNFVKLCVELSILSEGVFNTEFWIIAENPLSVRVLVTVIHGEIRIINNISLKDFTFLLFPRVYYGVNSYRSLVLKNNSQFNSTFYVTGELDCISIHLKEAKTKDVNYNYFKLTPISGRLPPNDMRPFLFTFSPSLKLLNLNGYNDTFLIAINIHKLYCTDLDSSRYEDDIFDETLGNTEIGTILSSLSTNEDNLIMSEFEDSGDFNVPMLPTESFFENTIKIILYGSAELASVTIIPDELILKNLILKETISRVIQLSNNSKNLPILYRYKKAAFVDINPKTGILKPLEKREITVYITHQSYDIIESELEFELLYYDNPNINKTVTVIGNAKLPILIEAKIVSKDKKADGVLVTNFDFKKPNQKPNIEVFHFLVKEQALLALPDDRAASLRPWNSTQVCRTIYAAMPRIRNVQDEYQLTWCELLRKLQTQEYYRKYTREQAMELNKHNHINEDNDADDIKLNNNCLKYRTTTRNDIIHPNFIPLSPAQLFNITIKPRNWIVENVVPHSEFTNFLEIINSNEIALRVYLKPHKSSQFRFPRANRAEILANTTHLMYFTCSTNKVGIEYHTLDVIINENHIFETSFTINVLPRTLLLSFREATFHANEKLFKYLHITNEYNGPIDFVWEFVGDLTVEPMSGCVKAKSTLTCMISYEIGNLELNNYELIIRVDNRRNQTVRIFLETIDIDVDFLNELDFEDVPIALTTIKYAPMKNKSDEKLWFESICTDLHNGLSVEPITGYIPPRGTLYFAVKLERYIVGTFESELKVLVGHTKEFILKIKCNVRFPNVQITPSEFKFKRIAASSFDIQCITLSNNDNILSMVQFDVDRYPELHYSEYSDSDFIEKTDKFIINPGEHKTFSIHFYPFFSFATYYFLPLHINTFNHSSSEIKLPTLKMYAAVLSHRVIIQTWKYFFTYFPHFEYKSTTRHIINVRAHGSVKFCIRLDEVKQPFSFKHIKGGQCINYTYSIVCELDSDEEVIFEAIFSPQLCGIYEIRLPFFIKNDLSDDLHNYFYFNATFHKPQIIFPLSCLHFGLIPLNVTMEKEIEIEFQYHNPDCSITVFAADMNLSCNFGTINIKSITTTFIMKFQYSSDTTHALNTTIHIYCNCGSSLSVAAIGGAENCFFSNHACVTYFKYLMDGEEMMYTNRRDYWAESRTSLYSVQSITCPNESAKYKFETSFPFFPTSDEPYTTYMNEVIVILESWIYEHAFYGIEYHTIPDTISKYTIKDYKKKPNEKKPNEKKPNLIEKTISLPYHIMLYNICGSAVTKLFNLGLCKNDNVTLKLYHFYYDVLVFLEKLGGLVPHIKPECLLPFDDYCDYRRLSNKVALSFDRFYLQSKQCWLDLTLQTYKCLIYKRIPIGIQPNSSNISFKKSIVSNLSYTGLNNDNVYSTEATQLMSWLNRHLQNYKDYMIKHIFTQESCEYHWINQKYIQNFDDDLADGLAFCAITLHYCPYLRNELKGMYEEPSNEEEHFHNAHLLINAWEMLRMRFQMEPNYISKPNALRMFFFLTYLYEFLIYIKPKEGLQFTTPLSSSISENIYISNQNKQTIKYYVFFFGNNDEVFSLSSNKISLLPDNACQITITYHAKFMKKAQATLIISGEFKGRRCMQSKAFNLMAMPSLTNPIKTIYLEATLYRRKRFCISMQVPYKEIAEYNLLFTTTDVLKYDDPSHISFQSFKSSNSMARINLDKTSFKTNNNGVFKMCGWVCSITNNERVIHTFGKNETVGDFYIIIVVKCKPKSNASIIYLSLPFVFKKINCICKKKETPDAKCQKYVKVKVPSRNETMWQCIMSQFLQDVDDSDLEFWQANRDTVIGIDLLKRILNDNKSGIDDEMQYIFKKNNKYYMNSNNKNIVLEKVLEICNTSATTDTTDLAVHITNNIDSFLFTMISMDGLEFRNYKVIIKYNTELT